MVGPYHYSFSEFGTIAIIAGQMLQIQPTELTVDPRSTATFKCTYSCSFKEAHLILWVAGYGQLLGEWRQFSVDSVPILQDEEITDIKTCDGGDPEANGIQQLRVTVDSPATKQQVPVQCVAMPNYAVNHSLVQILSNTIYIPTSSSALHIRHTRPKSQGPRSELSKT